MQQSPLLTVYPNNWTFPLETQISNCLLRVFHRCRRTVNSMTSTRKTKSPYMASTTLSDRKFEQIVWCFTINCTIREAAERVGVSIKTVKNFYELLFHRLFESTYYIEYYFFGVMLSDLHSDVLWNMTDYAKTMMKRNRGINKNESLYFDKYCTQYFYKWIFFGANQRFLEDNYLYKHMFNDTIKIIKLSGPLNRQMTNELKTLGFVSQITSRRVPRILYREIKKFSRDNNITDRAIMHYFFSENQKYRIGLYRDGEISKGDIFNSAFERGLWDV